jgi:hypothetical protein
MNYLRNPMAESRLTQIGVGATGLSRGIGRPLSHTIGATPPHSR